MSVWRARPANASVSPLVLQELARTGRANEEVVFIVAALSQTNDRAFETYVEEILLTRGRSKSGTNAEWDKERALFPAQVFAFIHHTQPELWSEMQALHAAGLEPLVLTASCCRQHN